MKTIKKFFQKNIIEILIGAVFVFWYLLLLPHIPIFDGDTFYYLAKAKHMLTTGDWLNTSTMMAKPVFGLWMVALSLKIFGQTLWGAYFWHTIFSALTLLAVYAFAIRATNQRIARLSVVVLMTSLMFFYQSASPMLDIPMVFFLVVAQWFVFEFISSGNFKYVYATALVCGLSFLTKGLEPAVTPAVTVALFWFLNKINPFKTYKNILLHTVFSLLIFSVVVSLWVVPQVRTHGSAFGQVLYRENVERFFHPIDETGGYRHVSSKTQIDPHLNLLYLILAFLPWSALLIPAIGSAYKQNYFGNKPLMTFLLAWFYFLLFVTTFSGHYKGPRYLLPLLPAAAMLVAAYLDQLLLNKKIEFYKLAYRSFAWLGAFFGLLVVVLLNAKYMHGEERYLPLVVPLFVLIALQLFLGFYFWKKKHILTAACALIVVSSVAYTVFLTQATISVKKLIPEYVIAQQLTAKYPDQPVSVYKNKIAAMDFYLQREVRHSDEANELKGLVVAEKRFAEEFKRKTVLQEFGNIVVLH